MVEKTIMLNRWWERVSRVGDAEQSIQVPEITPTITPTVKCTFVT